MPEFSGDVEIDLYQPNVLTAEQTIVTMSKLYHKALQELKWARRRQLRGGFQHGDEQRVAILLNLLRDLGGAPTIDLQPVAKVALS